MQRGRNSPRRKPNTIPSRQHRHRGDDDIRGDLETYVPRQRHSSGQDYYSSKGRTDSHHPNDQNLTKWSYYHDGEVEIPEICVYSIDKRCSYEDKGCQRLHAKCTSQWQIQDQSRWYNLRNFHSKEIEDAFEDVTRDGNVLSTVDPVKLGSAGKDMFKILGSSQWEADFESMSLQMKDTHIASHKIRRLSTQSSALSKSAKATTYAWYFLDINDKWIKYGENDSTSNRDYVSSITSEEIEKQFNTDKSLPMNFSTSNYQYVLDLESLQQTNTNTSKVRPVRRRPVKKASTRPPKQDASNSNTGRRNQDALTRDLPDFWDSMKPTDPMITITLGTSANEFREISGLLLLTLPSKRAVSIRRIQNPFLWRPFQNKKNELLLKYKNEKKLNIQRLFHGTREEYVESICNENFDWRLHGTNVGQAYGRGSYFSNSAAYASLYCKANQSGHSFLLVAEAIVGEIVRGDSGMTRPPKNPNSGMLYDTTVDDVATPKIFVKYDKQEYCPLYVIEFK